MDNKKLIIIIAAVLAIVLLGAVFVGLLGGKDAGQNGDYKKPGAQTTETTTGETTESDGTGTGNESGSGEGNDSQGGGNQGGTTATEQGDIRIEIDENGNLVIPTPGGNSNNNNNNSGSSDESTAPTQSSESTDSTEENQEQQSTKPTGSNTELYFSDFWGKP